MMELIKSRYAINASMHCPRNGLRDILKMFIKSWYTTHLFFAANRNSLTKYNLAGLTNGCLKMMSRQWTSAKIGGLQLIFFILRSYNEDVTMTGSPRDSGRYTFDSLLSL